MPAGYRNLKIRKDSKKINEKNYKYNVIIYFNCKRML